MAQYPTSVSSNRQQSFPTEIQQSFHPTHRLSVGGPPFANLFDQQINDGDLPRPRTESLKRINFFPPFLSLILGSTYFLVALCILLIVPILELAIGIAYYGQCRVNSYIPIYLIVTGACGIGGVGLTIVIVASFICCIKQDSIAGSCITGCVIGIILFIIFLMSFFLFIWFIVGNVWVFGANNIVITDDTNSPNYCNPVLYQFAFWIIILTYIMMFVSCCLSCCRACCKSVTTLKA